MFGFLKDKLKGALGKLTKEVEKEAVVETKETIVETKPEKKEEKTIKEIKATSKEVIKEEKPIKETKIKSIETTKEEKVKKTEEIKEEIPKIEEKKKGFFQKLFGKKDEEEIIEEKEELRKVAESTIIEPETTKKKIEETKEKPTHSPIPVQKKDIKTTKEQSVIKKEPQPIIHPTTKISKVPDKTIETKKVEQVTKTTSHSIPTPVQPIIKPQISKVEHEHKPILKSQETKPQTLDTKEKKEISNLELEKTQIKETIIPTPQVTQHTETKVIDKVIEKVTKVEPKIIEKPRHQIIEEERIKKTIPQEEKVPEHKGFFTKITETFTKIKISEEKFEELFWELEVVLLENNVAVEVIDKIKRDLKKELMTGKVSRSSVEQLVLSTLKQSIIELFDVEKIDLIANIKKRRKEAKPYIISIIGVNGSGKTTSIAKLAHKFQKEGLSVVLAASDTFRAAAIQQLEEHANKLNIKIIKHDYNSDPAAVAFDAIKYAEAKNIDVVLIDTAGRLHSNTNLMRELEKVIRVCKPDIKIFVGESITGNDCVEQAKEFDKAVGIDAIILAKADVDDKGGAAISVSYILKRPILYLGTGQTYDDLKEFNSDIIIKSLEL